MQTKKCKKDFSSNIDEAISVIPTTEIALIEELSACKDLTAPRTEAMNVLQKHMFVPTEKWHYKVISIISGVSEDKLEQLFEMAKKNTEKITNETK